MPDYVAPTIVLSTAAKIGSSAFGLRSDATIAAFDATVPVTQAPSDAAAVGSAAFAARRDHKHGMPRFWTVQAFDTSEYSTSSASSADLVTISGINIPATSPLRIQYRFRTSLPGAQRTVYYGLKLNSTTVSDVGLAVTVEPSFSTGAGGVVDILLLPRITNHTYGGSIRANGEQRATGAAPVSINNFVLTDTAEFPTVAITSLAIRGFVSVASAITSYVSNIIVLAL